ncbi:MAG: Sodium:neurotransmitter symporter family protein [Methanoregula sp. PtaU1.Bin051]|nr:MAG: Sodium:neurotransmitter symporter family protein [Methanoregula sp. PtaU1.Bin051]
MDRWSSHIGFILAAVGAAVGLGNIWRFSAVLGLNGGGAYLVPYFVAVFIFALPLMVLEITVGRRFRGTVVSAFASVRPQFRAIGWLLCAVSFLILSYYIVITGWTIAYMFFSATGETVTFAGFTGSYWPVTYTIVSVLVTGLIVSAGVREGIERLSAFLVPACVLILVIMVLYSTTLPGFSEGMRYFLTPDFSVLAQPGLWLAAFGQALFSLSVGEGILLTYGAYVAQDQDLRKAALIITIADVSVALLAGIVIFPVVFSYGLSPAIGSELAFTTLPLAFSVMPGGRLFATAFFALLLFAAITSSVSMLEVCVAAVREAAGWARKKTAAIMTGILLLTALLPALSYSAMRLSLFGVPLLDFMDETVGTLGLHIVAILLAVVFTAFVPPSTFWSELGGGTLLNRCIFALCRYLIPAALLLTVAAEVAAGMHMPALSFIPGTQYIGTVLQAGGVAFFVFLIVIVIIIVRKLLK